ncbi:extracellular solute-binding protein [Salipaludibacillus sp. HK11]|uniref:extracellular solute-binding protein n=1 Tax=Salipaludibacillus sp. HK11 TaxID=3394320 RepID=UPI0039FCCC9B
MKKVFMIFIVVSLVFIILTDFSSNNEEVTRDLNHDSNVNSNDVSEGEIKLNAMIIKHPITMSSKNMLWLQKAEERAGVEIHWEEVTADWDEKKNAMLAGGDIPHLIVGPNAITDDDFAQFTGLFQDLNELIDHAPNVQKMFEDKPEIEIIATQQDGEIYGLPKYQRYSPKSATMQFINKDWLDNLGLNMPTTWNELHQVLLAFKNEDANGNGDPDDEIPFDWAPVGTSGFGFFHPTVLLGSTGITPSESGTGYFAEDGELKNFFMDERYKDVVIFLNKLWKDDLINQEVFTQEFTSYQSMARGDGRIAKVGYTFGWEIPDRFGNQLASQYKSFPPMKISEDSTNEVRWAYDYNVLNYGENMIQMSAQTEEKEAAMRFINELYDPETSMQVLFGSIGESIDDHGDGTYSVLPPANESIDPGTWKWTKTWAENGPMYLADSLELELGADMQTRNSQQEAYQDAYSRIDIQRDVYPGIFIKYSQEDNTEMSLRNKDLMNLAMAKFAEWITEGTIEDEWDWYIDQLITIGLPENLELMQHYFDDYLRSVE